MPDGRAPKKGAAGVAAGATEMKVPGRGVADPDWIRIQSGQWIRIRIRAKMIHKSRIFFFKFMFSSVGWPLLRELKASSVTWTFFMEA